MQIIDSIIENHREPGELITILKKTQEQLGYLSEDTQTYIAKKLNMPVSQICGVVTFYSLFTTKPRGKHTINVCLGTACYVKGAGDILKSIKSEYGINDDGETTKDNLFTLQSSRCVGACGLAPVVIIDDEIYGKLKPSEIKDILNKYKTKGENKS